MEKLSKVKEKTKYELITAFWMLYEKKNIGKIKIAELTNTAGYHRATFYEYFKDIYDLLEQEETSLINELKETITCLYSSNESGSFEEVISDFYLRNGKHLNILLIQGNTAFMSRFKEILYPLFLDVLNLGNTIENRLIIEYGLSGMLMTLNKWYENGQPIPMENFIKLIHSLVFNGVLKTALKLKDGNIDSEGSLLPGKIMELSF